MRLHGYTPPQRLSRPERDGTFSLAVAGPPWSVRIQVMSFGASTSEHANFVGEIEPCEVRPGGRRWADLVGSGRPRCNQVFLIGIVTGRTN
jgi:hypothetical protein